MQGHLEEDFNRWPVPHHVRSPRGFHQDLFKSSAQGPVQDHANASDSMSLGSPQDLHTRICKRPWARSSCQDPLENFTRSSWKGPAAAGADLTRSCCKNLPRASTRAFIQAQLRHGICKLLTQGPFRQDLTRTSGGPSVKDVYRIMQGPLRKEFRRIHTRVCKSRYMREFTMCRGPRAWGPRGADFARACSVEMHMDMSQERKFTGKMQRPKIATVCASLCSQNAHGDVTRAIFCARIYRKPDGAPWSSTGLYSCRKNT